MAHYLPPQIMAFFRPPPPLPYAPPVQQRNLPQYSGVAQFIERFKDPIPPPVKMETGDEKRARRSAKKAERMAKRVAIQTLKWDPKKDTPELTKEPYKTLFVSNLAFDLTEEDVKHEFEFFGPVKRVRIVKDKEGKSRGYCFVEFEHTKDFEDAIKDADARKIKNRRIKVDVERGRTVKDWKPRRLGGGLGGRKTVAKPAAGSSRDGGRDFGGSSFSRGPPPSSYDRDRDRPSFRDRPSDRDRPRDRSPPRDRDRDRTRDDPRDRDRDRRPRSRSPERDRRRRDRSASPRRDRSRDRDRRR